MGASFDTTAGAGEHGAVIHYKPERDGEQRVIKKQDMLLVDSGGHFRDGTTDTTRTRHMSSCTEAQKRAFTRVLKGNIQLGTAVFPTGIVGHRLETLARKALWDVGLDYGHGTGHGVGQFLNVHEGPSWILSGPSPTDPGIAPGMIFSNEPGYYEVEKYRQPRQMTPDLKYGKSGFVEYRRTSYNTPRGVEWCNRAADLVSDFAGRGALGFNYISLAPHQTACLDNTKSCISDLVSDFAGRGALGFHYISLAPHQTACLDVQLLTDFEVVIHTYIYRVTFD
ncbi:metallopeptidase family m24 domain-containing protein [Phthorimaea operculella]|nr:metallopeptidase family m24 domain-containing protein [Phthorimaea operculella]